MNRNTFGTFRALFAALAAPAAPLAAHGQTLISEDFTGTTTSNPWFFFADACLTASSAAGVQPSGSGNGQLPGCVAIQSTYNENLVGGQNGVAGSTQTLPDPNGQGALRFTNGAPAGYSQNGAIVSGGAPFPAGAGIQVTFNTVTYRGKRRRAGRDGADRAGVY